MSRFAREMTVVFWEEPVEIGAVEAAYLKVRRADDFPQVRVVTPHLPEGLDENRREEALSRLLDAHVSVLSGPLVTWYYTPMMLPFSRHLGASVTVYDCMDEL
ncbi:MAG TPA: UDP-galactopyranose mutase, partial [Polyangia bacterium]